MNACKVSSAIHDFNEMHIVFGSEGGFAGTYKAYTLRPDGSLMIERAKGERKEQLAGAELQATLDCFSMARALYGSYEAKAPGNLSRFIEVYEKGEVKFSSVWEDGLDVRPEVVQLYSSLIKLVKSDNPVM